MTDLLQPTRQRARVILSNIVNQLQFIQSINFAVSEDNASLAKARTEFETARQQSKALEAEVARLECVQFPEGGFMRRPATNHCSPFSVGPSGPASLTRRRRQ